MRDGTIAAYQWERGAVPGAFPACGISTEREDLAAPDGTISAIAGAVEGSDDCVTGTGGKEAVFGE